MAGIRNQTAEPGRYAAFGFTSDGTAYFYMLVDGAAYWCWAPPSLNDTIKLAMASSGYFGIQFNVNTGICTSLTVEAGSAYKNASAL